MSGQWEVVGGKTNKKSKVPVAKSASNSKIKETNSFQAPDPFAEKASLYSALLMGMQENQKDKDKKEKPAQSDPPKTTQKNNIQQHQKKKKNEKKSPPVKLTIEKAFSSVTVEELKSQLATLQAICPDLPQRWLKELTSFLNSKLDVAVEDPVFSTKPSGYPFNLLERGVGKEIIKITKQCKSQQLDILFESTVNDLVSALGKGNHGMGCRLMLQCLAQEMPNVVKNNISKCLDVCNTTLNRPPVCLSILWAAGQAGNKNLEIGFQVWSEVMFPLIGNKNCANYIVDYLEKLVVQAEGKPAKSLLGVKEFFPLLDLVYSKEFSRGSCQKRMLSLLPTLKTLSYGPDTKNVLRLYFPSYLRRLEPQCPPPLSQEILKSLVHCLEVDSRCYSIWRQLYTKHFLQSKMLISYIREQWNNLSHQFPKHLLLETLSVFQVTNNELAATRKKDTDLQDCIKVTQDLIRNLNKSLSKGRRWLFYGFICLLAVLIILIQYDVSIHGSFAASKSRKLMKEYGILAASSHVVDNLKLAQSCVQKYLPAVHEFLTSTLAPALESLLTTVGRALLSFWESTKDLRSICAKNIHPLLQKFDEICREYVPIIASSAQSGLTVISSHLSAIFGTLLEYLKAAMVSIQSSPYVISAMEIFSEHASNVADAIKHISLYAYSILQNYIPT